MVIKDALYVLQPPSELPEPIDLEMDPGVRIAIVSRMEATFGTFFTKKLMGDRVWVDHVLKGAEE